MTNEYTLFNDLPGGGGAATNEACCETYEYVQCDGWGGGTTEGKVIRTITNSHGPVWFDDSEGRAYKPTYPEDDGATLGVQTTMYDTINDSDGHSAHSFHDDDDCYPGPWGEWTACEWAVASHLYSVGWDGERDDINGQSWTVPVDGTVRVAGYGWSISGTGITYQYAGSIDILKNGSKIDDLGCDHCGNGSGEGARGWSHSIRIPAVAGDVISIDCGNSSLGGTDGGVWFKMRPDMYPQS